MSRSGRSVAIRAKNALTLDELLRAAVSVLMPLPK